MQNIPQVKILLPEHVKHIINTLEKAGHEAYAVGGCVRDCIMGREPNDWDITTSADPLSVKALFPRTIDTGLKHGTVTIMMDHTGYEVTTYRIDGDYEDGRHPKEVVFTKSLKEDLLRRDFTINAMAYNEKDGLVDLFNGMEDLEAGIIRCVGNAADRFSEDALRIMRAVRFSAQFGFKIESETSAAIRSLAHTLEKISAERIQTELVKLLVSPHPEYIRIAYECGITKIILPEFDACMCTEQNNPHHCYSVGEHIIHSMEKIEADKVLRMTMLFHDIAKPITRKTDKKGIDHFLGHAEKSAEIAKTVLRRLKFDNDTIDKVTRLVKYHDWTIPLSMDISDSQMRHQIVKIGRDAFPDIFYVNKADLSAQSEYLMDEKMHKQEILEAVYHKIVDRGDPLSLKEIAVTGQDLIQLGMKPGKELGETLNKLFQIVLDNPEKNEKDVLLELVHIK